MNEKKVRCVFLLPCCCAERLSRCGDFNRSASSVPDRLSSSFPAARLLTGRASGVLSQSPTATKTTRTLNTRLEKRRYPAIALTIRFLSDVTIPLFTRPLVRVSLKNRAQILLAAPKIDTSKQTASARLPCREPTLDGVFNGPRNSLRNDAMI